jgi:CRISP-associated protein Cas1
MKIRKLRNTLYVTTPESYLSRDGENIVISLDGAEKFRMPIHNLESIVCFNFMGVTPGLMQLCAERSVGLCFVSPYGKFLGRVTGHKVGNILLRRKHYKISEENDSIISISVNFITGKILNSRAVLSRVIRDHADKININSVRDVIKYHENCITKLSNSKTHDTILGIEGDCSKGYFSVFNELIVAQKEDFYMKGRSRRPPMDYVNALLSFFYTLLAHDVQSALETVGLDPYLGFLHRPRPGRASLALDLMEELRPYLVDRFVLSMINRKQVTKKDFILKENGAVLLCENSRKNILQEWQKRKQEEITHPFLDEKISIGLLPYAQSMLLARFIRGDFEAYPPFLWK